VNDFPRQAGPYVSAALATHLTIHGTPSQLRVMSEVIMGEVEIVTIKPLEPCDDPDTPDCRVLEVVVINDVDLARIYAAYRKAHAAQN
jgi:hypothetical protein